MRGLETRLDRLEAQRNDRAAPVVCLILEEGQPIPDGYSDRLILIVRERIVPADGEGGDDATQ